MNNIIADLHQFAQQQNLCAVYFLSHNGLSNLKFHYMVQQKDKLLVSPRTLNDDKFFNQLYKQQKISKNKVLEYIHSNIKKEQYIHLPSGVDVVITVPLK